MHHLLNEKYGLINSPVKAFLLAIFALPAGNPSCTLNIFANSIQMKKTGLISLLCLFVFVCCKKSPQVSPVSPVVRNTPSKHVSHYPVGAEIKAYGSFKPGTYWIYQDSTSHALDSVYVTRLDSGKSLLGMQNDTCDWFEVTTQSTFTGQKHILAAHRLCLYWIATGGSPSSGSVIDTSMMVINYKDSVNSLQTSVLVRIPYVQGLNLPPFSFTAENNTSVFNLNAILIPNVIQTSEGTALRSLVAKKYGLLRQVRGQAISAPGIWNLIRCHIIQ
jgi:hypothetical protein